MPESRISRVFELRCTNKRIRKRDNQEVECRRFLATFDRYSIFMICPNCGQPYRVTAGSLGRLKIEPVEDGHPIIHPQLEECHVP